jgi:hypothetical protein
MKLDNFVVVSGLPGVYRMAANRSNGLIVEDPLSGKRRFAPARRHQFTPLESVAIYTDDGDSAPLDIVFRNMRDQLDDNPPIDPSASADALYEYFADILPNYDRDQVHAGDIKKVIKWFVYLQEGGLLEDTPTEEEE